MRVGLREGVALWRRAGLDEARGRCEGRDRPRRAAPFARPSCGRDRCTQRPARSATALGGPILSAALRGPVAGRDADRRARSSVDLGRRPSSDRADEVVAHRFDLLGSGPTELGPEIDWRADFKTGRRWPLRHGSLLAGLLRRRLRHQGSVGALAVPAPAAPRGRLPVDGRAALPRRARRQLSDWIAGESRSSSARTGPARWTSRSGRRTGSPRSRSQPRPPRTSRGSTPALESLLLHGRFIRAHLEDGQVRGNHYLSDVVGLLPVAALFSASREGRRWAEWAAGELASEMEHQVRADGCEHEASIPYHRLVTELFVCGTQAAEALLPGRLPPWYHERLDLMLDFVADYTRPDGLAPQVGDADDGRFLPLGDYGARPARPPAPLRAGRPRASSRQPSAGSFPESGFYVMRAGRPVRDRALRRRRPLRPRRPRPQRPALVRAGERAQSRSSSIRARYLYTPDPEARNLFRSTGFHSTLRVDGAEQNELRTDDLFSMRRPRAGRGAPLGRHRLRRSPPRLSRGHAHTAARAHAEKSSGSATPSTREAARELEWTFPLAPGAENKVEIRAEGLEFRPEQGWYSPSYGVRVPTTFLRAHRRSRPGRGRHGDHASEQPPDELPVAAHDGVRSAQQAPAPAPSPGRRSRSGSGQVAVADAAEPLGRRACAVRRGRRFAQAIPSRRACRAASAPWRRSPTMPSSVARRRGDRSRSWRTEYEERTKTSRLRSRK